MASTYSTLKFELIATGEQSGSWGTTTNTNLGTAIQEAIAGRATANFTADADLTLTLTDTNATQVARNYILNVTSGVSLTATRNLIVPTINKPYIVKNATTGGQSIIVKTSAGTGVTIPNGKTTTIYADGTNVVSDIDYIPAVSLGTALPVASGGTGAATFTVNNVLLGNGTSAFQVVAPGASGNFLSSNGTTWTSSTTLGVANGGTGATSLTANNVILGNGTSTVLGVAPGASGNVLTSNGTTWTSSAPASSSFPAGTRMSFQQTAAPTGWTKDTTAAINDSILRLVTGTASSGGSVAFSTWAASASTGAFTLTSTEIPSHNHTWKTSNSSDFSTYSASNYYFNGSSSNGNASSNIANTVSIGATGGGGSHSHSLSQNIKYYDFIIASKN